MVIFVAGCAGFIGSNFVDYYIRNHSDDYVVGYDLLTYAGNLASLSNVLQNPNFKFFRGDINDGRRIEEIFYSYNPDIIVNFAAETHVDRSIFSAEKFIHTNINGTSVLADIARKFDIKRYHQVSTDEVYGSMSLAEKTKFSETSLLKPSNPYSASKSSADLFLLSYYYTYNFPVTISRCTNNYGPNQHIEKLIPLIITRALTNKFIPIYGTGENVRDWIYVEDHCRAIDCIIHNGNNGEIYNIAAHNEVSNIEVVKMILKLLDKPESLIKFVPDRLGHDIRYSVNYSKITTQLGWDREIAFPVGIKRTIDWYLNNEDWWTKLRE